MLLPFEHPDSSLARAHFHLRFLSPAEVAERVSFPVFATGIRAGFPSPAADFVEGRLDLNDLIQHHEATFFAWCEGDSMTGLGLRDGDLLVIDKAVEPEMGDIVVAEINAEFTVKRLGRQEGKPHLLPANPAYPPIPVPPEGIQVWGVVIRVIHDPRPRAKRRQP
ncbi:LexA family protein [Rhodocyclus tenuis]|uniref:DNA polymerase V n=1 Tax=Rhodocyclus tenuis TaxID=1066 RepID=A0A840GA98_RHOTE|nr:translesion error-prone DNA polymerase V autoproteolytic subunit [Rhodocyclus tenuis]MBB4248795.1 DNA polymerase V [Rhodocyclus tenuis]